MAIAGTNPYEFKDLLNDIYLGVKGKAYEQEISLESFYKNLINNGVIGKNEQIDVAGHSLGGFLAQIFLSRHKNIVDKTYTYNSPSIGGVVENIKKLFGDVQNIHSDKVYNIIAKNGPIFTAAAGTHTGKNVEISQSGHGSIDLANKLSLYAMFIQADSNLNIEDMTKYCDAIDKSYFSLYKKSIDVFNKILNLKSLGDYRDDIINIKNNLNSTLDIDFLYSALLVNKNFSSSSLSTPALYALINLNPFIVSNINSSAYDEIAKFKDEYSTNYIKDKAKMLESALDNTKNTGTYFSDKQSGVSLDLTQDFNNIFDEYHFGTNSNDTITSLGTKNGEE
ncbi:hypothetical protein [Campylobacter geochelonis]|uniref:Type I secretion target GGXGXDXXX repeat-containing protein n=1 Tax=Campylobacter geochelonis TaxID=1780362 RepID=A0A128EJL8_9BACT|nr:hypothetical protein [Campylobacter geochelonis]QKF71502.1 putative lipase [Campylobacter geochelonis]CZE48443.1 type I secretion target GGXGXDXXX repeat-containing protein [Campylobacter geochelonis]